MEQSKIYNIVQSGQLQAYNQQRQALIRKSDFQALKNLENEYKNDNTKRDVERCRLLLKQRKNRVARRIKDMALRYECDCYFLTLTFRDDVLRSTTPAQRRDMVARFLSARCGVYVANIDFGDDKDYIDDYGEMRKGTKREHYHAFVNKKIDYSEWFEKCGAMIGERFTRSEYSADKVSEYITKLTNHSLKASTLSASPIFSRGGGVEVKRSVWTPKKNMSKESFVRIIQLINAKIRQDDAICPFKMAVGMRKERDFKRFIKYQKSKKNISH